jgi:hypothetical protein
MAERKCLPDSGLQWVWLPENIDEKNTGAIIMAFNLFCGIYRK